MIEQVCPDCGADRSDNHVTTCRFHPDYDWTSTCPHLGDDACPDGDNGCRCECHAVAALGAAQEKGEAGP